jgi:hypothetical protein
MVDGRCKWARPLGLASLVALLVGGVVSEAKAVSVLTTDFIADSDRTNFAGFEGLPFRIDGGIHIEDGLRIEQVNKYPHDIFITSQYLDWSPEGTRSWYPNGGDWGYTRITRTDGSDFVDLGLLRGSGHDPSASSPALLLMYQLFDDGNLVQQSTLLHQHSASYLGFAGGGFMGSLPRASSTISPMGSLSTASNWRGSRSQSLNPPRSPCSAPASLASVWCGVGERRPRD